MKNQVKKAFALAIAVGVVAAGCGSTSKGSAAGGASSSSSGPIILGQTNPKSGSSAILGTETYGAEALYKEINAHGGINGRTIKLISLDDAYNPTQTLSDTKQLVYNDHIFADVGPNGTPQTQAALGLLDPLNIPVVGPQTGGEALENKLSPNVYYTFPKYSLDGETLGKFEQSKLHLSRVGVLYQNDDFGKSLLNGLLASGVKPAVSVPYDPSQVDFSSDAVKFKSAGVQGIFLLSLVGPTVSFLHSLASTGYTGKLLLSSVAASSQSISASGPIIQGAYIGAFIPPLTSSGGSQVQQFLSAMATYEPGQPVNVYSAWGWLSAQVAVAGLKGVHGALTHKSFENALNSLANLATIGGPISYTATDHTGLKQETVLQIQGQHRVPVSGAGNYSS